MEGSTVGECLFSWYHLTDCRLQAAVPFHCVVEGRRAQAPITVTKVCRLMAQLMIISDCQSSACLRLKQQFYFKILSILLLAPLSAPLHSAAGGTWHPRHPRPPRHCLLFLSQFLLLIREKKFIIRYRPTISKDSWCTSLIADRISIILIKIWLKSVI